MVLIYYNPLTVEFSFNVCLKYISICRVGNEREGALQCLENERIQYEEQMKHLLVQQEQVLKERNS